jgi:hypothetical protein
VPGPGGDAATLLRASLCCAGWAAGLRRAQFRAPAPPQTSAPAPRAALSNPGPASRAARRWVSAIGAVMSIGYSAIAATLSALHASSSAGTPAAAPHGGRLGASHADVVFGTLNSLGGVAFTFGGQAVMPEIQARAPPLRPRGRGLRVWGRRGHDGDPGKSPSWGAWPVRLGPGHQA